MHLQASTSGRVPLVRCIGSVQSGRADKLTLQSSIPRRIWPQTRRSSKCYSISIDQGADQQPAVELAAPVSSDPKGNKRASFFDVDGTLVDSNIVLPYVLVRLRELPLLLRLVWAPYFALKCVYFIALDSVDRGAFNRVFYRHYAGRGASDEEIAEQAQYVYRTYLQPKIYPGARERVAQLKAEGYDIVLVTGSLDFLMQPLAGELGADYVIAAALEREGGRYTGELRGGAVVAAEKVARMQAYAAERGMQLANCCAYSDSMSDMPMLEVVGTAAVVGPGGRLRKEAQARGWEVLDWRP